MSATDTPAPELTDPELITLVREGDVGAYGTLFARHVDAATRLAQLLVRGSDADDLVSEAFVKVLSVLLAGGGPDVAFRAYLLTAVRRLHVDKLRGQQKVTSAGDMTPYDPGVPFTDTAVAGFEGGAAAKAFASLPERWQMVLWHLEVENQKPADIAPLLGMSANSVSALAYRAREGLRQAFLNMHSGDLVSDACRETNDLMGGYVRRALSRRDTARVEDHLDHCRRCTGVYLELAEVNSSLAGLLGPVLLGGAAAAYLSGGAVAGAAGASTVFALVGQARDLAAAHLPATAAATAAAVGVAGVTAVTIFNRGPDEQPTAAEPPPAAGITPSPTPIPSSAPTSPSSSPSAQRDTATASGDPTTSALAGSATTDPDVDTGDTGDPVVDPVSNGNGASGTNGGNGNGSGPTDPPVPTPSNPEPSTPTPSTPTPSTPAPSNPVPSNPTPSNPTPSNPTPTPPPLRADVAVSVSATFYLNGNFHVRLHVGGVPGGETVRLRATTSAGGLHSHNGGTCQRSGTSFDCTTSSNRLFLFGAHNSSQPRLTFTITPPPGWTDPAPGNNSVSVTAPRSSTGGGND